MKHLKVCTLCGEAKANNEFDKKAAAKDGLSPWCKRCTSAKSSEYYIRRYHIEGVYIIINTVSGKVYIGSTVDLKLRQRMHFSYLRQGTHDNPHLQHSWNRYGESAFEFMICEYVEDKEQLHIREQYWLDFHRMFTEVYNMGPCARHPMLNTHPSEETRSRQSAAQRRRTDRKGLPYPAFTHEVTGEVIPAGTNMRSMCQEHDLNYKCMWKVAHSHTLRHHGWLLLDKDSRYVPKKNRVVK